MSTLFMQFSEFRSDIPEKYPVGTNLWLYRLLLDIK
jgi:hypothetical protein